MDRRGALPGLNMQLAYFGDKTLTKRERNWNFIIERNFRIDIMRELVLTPKFKRTFRKFVLRNPQRQKAIEKTLAQMREDIYFLNLGTHSLKGELSGLKACSCGYDCRIIWLS